MRLAIYAILILFNCSNVFAQMNNAKILEKKVSHYNNEAKYDSSQSLIQQFLNTPNISNDDSYQAYLQLSYTYKRLFDYKSTLKYLEKALTYGVKTNNKVEHVNRINSEIAFALFDMQDYAAADSIMDGLAKNNFEYIDTTPLSYLYMQQGYIHFLANNYTAAKIKYDFAISLMQKHNPCDLPMIYGKKIQLYGKLKDVKAMKEMYNNSIKIAEVCGIEKYKLYTNQMMAGAFYSINNTKLSLHYQLIFDSLNDKYNQRNHLDKIIEFEKKYEADKKDYSLKIQSQKITQLISIIIGLILIGLLYIVLNSRKKLKKEKEISTLHTKQLLEKTEDERKRIAADLHDSINNELLNLKSLNGDKDNNINDKIDDIINDIRNISRNLHPVLFESLGLKMSLENLFERMQLQHQIIINSEINYSKQLSSNAELQVYRMIQETLINTVKYAGAYAAKVTIETQQNFIQIQIRDSGKGFQVAEKMKSGKAFGLHNIIQRSKALGGETNIESNEKGTTITIKIPIKK